jgi:hypothetical protein
MAMSYLRVKSGIPRYEPSMYLSHIGSVNEFSIGVTDLLLDGPYVRDLTDTSRPWLGSSNQRYHFLTPRYRHLEVELGDIPNRLEIRLQPDGKVFINGMAYSQMLEYMVSGVAKWPTKPQSTSEGLT